MIKVQILAHSINPVGIEAVSFLLTYPRFLHSELMTHRALSRNAASSRAIPTWKMIRTVWENPALPVSWGVNGSKMQAKGELTGWRRKLAEKLWRLDARIQCGFAWVFNKLGLHKQIANRVMEPFSHITVLATATDWGNFFNLRAHPDAQPEFQELTYQMLQAYVGDHPKKLLAEGEWHLPFYYLAYDPLLGEESLLKVNTARAARLSYLTFDGEFAPEKDYQLHDNLVKSGHWSPFEHALCARGDDKRSGNVRGYIQYRKLFGNENREAFDPHKLLESWRGQNAA
jgi:hypothetical protein